MATIDEQVNGLAKGIGSALQVPAVEKLFRRFEVALRGQDERDGEAEREQEHDEAHGPVRHSKEGEDLGRHLNQEPGNDRVGDGDLLNVAAFQLGEEVAQIHAAASEHSDVNPSGKRVSRPSVPNESGDDARSGGPG